MPTHKYQNHKIRIESYTSSRFLWFAIGLKVYVDGQLSAQSSSKLEGTTTKVPFTIDMGNAQWDCYVQSSKWSTLIWTPYRLFVQGKAIANGIVVARNWYMPCGVLIIMVVLAYLIAGILNAI